MSDEILEQVQDQQANVIQQTTENVDQSEHNREIDQSDVALVQALLFTNGEPLAIERLMLACSLNAEQLDQVCKLLHQQLESEASGLMLAQVGQAYQLRTKPGFAEQIRLLKASAPRRLSNAALETLAIVAYRQPIIKSDVERIRGVDATPTMKTLLERNLIKVVGHQPSVGQPALYGTTEEFLKLFGLSSLEQLPTLRDLKEFDSDPGEHADSEDAQIEQQAQATAENTDSSETIQSEVANA